MQTGSGPFQKDASKPTHAPTTKDRTPAEHGGLYNVTATLGLDLCAGVVVDLTNATGICGCV